LSPRYTVQPGERIPVGATVRESGVNFSIFSGNATAVSLVLYETADSIKPFQVIDLDPIRHRTLFYWHILVEGAEPGLYYTWQVAAPDSPPLELLDPWARLVSDSRWDRRMAIESPEPHSTFRGRVVPSDDYNWDGDLPVNHRFEDSIIYELHVGGFTRHRTAGARYPGTFEAILNKIPYLRDLGVTDVELMPVMAFDEQDVPERTARLGLRNFWGYCPYGFYAPHPRYAQTDDPRREFRDMVKALHAAGIGVILDVVLNHTAEGGAGGPAIHFKGLDRKTFYHLEPDDPRRYRDYTGCGNTLNCNHPLVADFIVRCLEYWVQEMHVDGFRLDLASVLARGEDGEPTPHAPVLWAIEFSPVLAHTKLIAEAWDATGLYQVGDFPGFRWMEWNGEYRDTVRQVVGGMPGLIKELATRIAGSSDHHEGKGKLPINTVNYVTCHDGFTLLDLVSYDRKQNLANGEGNRDGSDANYSWNCGVDGPTDDPDILDIRRRLVRNYVAVLLVSQGVPMLLAGDEVLRTQEGNNNAYCQDNQIGWFDWNLVETNRDMLRFTREMIALRKRHRALRRRHFLSGKPGTGRAGQRDVVWHGARGGPPRWDDAKSQVLGCTLAGQEDDEGDLHIMLNMSARMVRLMVPPARGQQWFRAVDTSVPSPGDIVRPDDQQAFTGPSYPVDARSVVVLESRPEAGV
jgi:glycogen operon protein